MPSFPPVFRETYSICAAVRCIGSPALSRPKSVGRPPSDAENPVFPPPGRAFTGRGAMMLEKIHSVPLSRFDSRVGRRLNGFPGNDCRLAAKSLFRAAVQPVCIVGVFRLRCRRYRQSGVTRSRAELRFPSRRFPLLGLMSAAGESRGAFPRSFCRENVFGAGNTPVFKIEQFYIFCKKNTFRVVPPPFPFLKFVKHTGSILIHSSKKYRV